jgi:hypothetical protein
VLSGEDRAPTDQSGAHPSIDERPDGALGQTRDEAGQLILAHPVLLAHISKDIHVSCSDSDLACV